MRRLSLLSLFVVWCLLMGERPVHAYMDPGAGSMFIQLVLGGAAGLGIIAKLYWRKFLTVFGVRPQDAQAEKRQPLP